MSALLAIERQLITLGYSSQVQRRDYRFADVFAADSAERSVELAAFTQIPVTYRSAAFGVVEARDEEAVEVIAARRALGAPFFLSIAGERVSVWEVGASGDPQRKETVRLDGLDELFERNRERWNPQALHRAKVLPSHAARQLGFDDLGLLPVIEGELQKKLDVILGEVLHLLLDKAPNKSQGQAEMAFRVTFRLLAAKILKDCKHSGAAHWEFGDVNAVLGNIADYYQLPDTQATWIFPSPKALASAWEVLSNSISLKNISADTLAFVYENTLVTPENRKLLSIHSTPRQLADYVLRHLDLSRFNRDTLRIYEPFAGAGVFLVSALRHLQDLLPIEWTHEARHSFLISRIAGSELDAFACEVATLSLMLADYPNANGWKDKIERKDLFEKGGLEKNLAGSTVVLCNPPFEEFKKGDANRRIWRYKAEFVLMTALEAKPEALGFVMPHGLLHQDQYKALREKLLRQYKSLDLLFLPEGIFQQANFEAALLIATDRKPDQSNEASRVRLSIVEQKDRKTFLDTGLPGSSRVAVRPAGSSELWIRPLEEDLSEWLDKMPRLGTVVEVCRGLQWKPRQASTSTDIAPPLGFRRGIYSIKDSLRAYKLKPQASPLWLNFNKESLRRPKPPSLPWEKPKVLVNALRITRNRWRLTAAADVMGLAASQQFFGVWPKEGGIPIDVLTAILNSPLTSICIPAPTTQNLANEMLENLPLPMRLDEPELLRAVANYRAGLDAMDEGLAIDESELETRLRWIDELVLDGYGLPKHLRQMLFDYFAGEIRPVPHRFSGWGTPPPSDKDVLKAARERALARGKRRKVLDLDTAGGGLSLQAVAELLNEPLATVERRVEQRTLLALPSENELLFPAFQFYGHAPLPGLHEFLAVFPDQNPWACLNYLVNPDLRLNGKCPIESLRSGEVDLVIAAARQVGEHAAG